CRAVCSTPTGAAALPRASCDRSRIARPIALIPATTPRTRAFPPASASRPLATRPSGPGSPAAWKARLRTPCSAARRPAPAPGPDLPSSLSRSFAFASPALKPLSTRKVLITASKAILLTLLHAARRGREQHHHGDRRPDHDGNGEADREHQHSAHVARRHARTRSLEGR